MKCVRTRVQTWAVGALVALAASSVHADGARPGPTPIDPRVMPRPRLAVDRDRAYVARLYQDLLAHPGDPSSVDALVQMLAKGTPRAQVVQTILASDEYRDLLVRGLYTRLLRRNPTPVETQSMRDVLGSGGTEEQVTVTLTASPEYFHQRANDSNATFVDQVYQDLVGRAPDAGSRSSLVAQLDANTPRSAVVQSLVAGAEYAATVVQSDYARYLHRAPTPGERAQGVAIVQQGHSRDLQVTILASQEYYDR
jgi:hypothetical protein